MVCLLYNNDQYTFERFYKTCRMVPYLLVVFPLAAARLYRVATSLKLLQCPINFFSSNIYPFNHCKANKLYSFRIYELIISTHCNFYSFESLSSYLTCHAIKSRGSGGICSLIAESPASSAGSEGFRNRLF